MSFETSILDKMNKIGIKLNNEQIEKFYKYEKILLEWNEKINLTAIVDENEIILKHFVDSAIITKYIKSEQKVADIGTGAGFPGIPLKIINKYNNIYLLDSLNKRIKFLEKVIETLELKNICAIHSRAEEIGHNKEFRQQFDVVVSRAVAKLNVLLEYMLPLAKVGGTCICLKGPNVENEIEEAQNALNVLGGKIEKIENFKLPDSDNERNLIFVKCIKQIQNKYPRKAGTPTTLPL